MSLQIKQKDAPGLPPKSVLHVSKNSTGNVVMEKVMKISQKAPPGVKNNNNNNNTNISNKNNGHYNNNNAANNNNRSNNNNNKGNTYINNKNNTNNNNNNNNNAVPFAGGKGNNNRNNANAGKGAAANNNNTNKANDRGHQNAYPNANNNNNNNNNIGGAKGAKGNAKPQGGGGGGKGSKKQEAANPTNTAAAANNNKRGQNNQQAANNNNNGNNINNKNNNTGYHNNKGDVKVKQEAQSGGKGSKKQVADAKANSAPTDSSKRGQAKADNKGNGNNNSNNNNNSKNEKRPPKKDKPESQGGGGKDKNQKTTDTQANVANNKPAKSNQQTKDTNDQKDKKKDKKNDKKQQKKDKRDWDHDDERQQGRSRERERYADEYNSRSRDTRRDYEDRSNRREHHHSDRFHDDRYDDRSRRYDYDPRWEAAQRDDTPQRGGGWDHEREREPSARRKLGQRCEEACANSSKTFSEYGLRRSITEALAYENITSPLPLQSKCIPSGINDYDVCAMAKDGTGKVLTWAIIALQRQFEKGGASKNDTSMMYPGIVVIVNDYAAATNGAEVMTRLESPGPVAAVTEYATIDAAFGCEVLITTVENTATLLLKKQLLSFERLHLLVIDDCSHLSINPFKDVVGCLSKSTPFVKRSLQTVLFSRTLDTPVDRLLLANIRKDKVSYRSVLRAIPPTVGIQFTFLKARGVREKQDLLPSLFNVPTMDKIVLIVHSHDFRTVKLGLESLRTDTNIVVWDDCSSRKQHDSVTAALRSDAECVALIDSSCYQQLDMDNEEADVVMYILFDPKVLIEMFTARRLLWSRRCRVFVTTLVSDNRTEFDYFDEFLNDYNITEKVVPADPKTLDRVLLQENSTAQESADDDWNHNSPQAPEKAEREREPARNRDDREREPRRDYHHQGGYGANYNTHHYNHHRDERDGYRGYYAERGGNYSDSNTAPAYSNQRPYESKGPWQRKR